MPDNKEVRLIDIYYTKAGLTLPENSYPVNRNTLIKWAEDLSRNKNLSSALQVQLDEFINKLSIQGGSETGEIDWSAGYEQYLRTEDHSENVAQDYLSELPLSVFGGSFVNYEYGGVCLELILKREYSAYPENNFFISKPGNPVALENQIVSKGYAFYSNDFLEMIIGRIPSHYGDPNFNSLMANKNLPFLDQVKLEMNIAGFRLEYYLASLENRRAAEDIDLSGTRFIWGENSIWTTMHRLVYSFDTFTMSLAEQSFLSRVNNQLYIGDITPISVLHNTWLSNINISIFTDFTWAVIPGLELYYQLGIDDINASDVFGISDSDIPTIDAHIFGIYHAGDIAGHPYSVKLEIGSTHYLWGSIDESDPLEEAIYRVYLDDGNILIPFSSPYGPGAIWAELDSEISTEFGLSGGLFFNYLNKNTLADLVTTPYARNDEVMADAPRTNRFEFGANINYNLFDLIDLYAKPAVLFSYTDDNGSASERLSWFECTIGGKISGNEVFSGFGD